MSRSIALARAVFVWSFEHDGRVRRVSVLEHGVDPMPVLFSDVSDTRDNEVLPVADGATDPAWHTASHEQRREWMLELLATLINWGAPPQVTAKAFLTIREFADEAPRLAHRLRTAHDTKAHVAA